METEKQKMGFWSIVLLGINGIIGSGIFLLPNQAMKLIGTASIGVFIFDALLVASITVCFAECASLFKVNGGPYIYAKAAFGEFIGYEVGFVTWAIRIIAEATMAVAFATALSGIIPAWNTTFSKNLIVTIVIIGLALMNISGVTISKIVNNIVTIAKLFPLVLFVLIGFFAINGSHFQPLFPGGDYQSGSFAAAAVLLFYAFTGFEGLVVAAGDMRKPEKNLPRAILLVISLVTLFYVLLQVVSIGILGQNLGASTAPIQEAFGKIAGSFGTSLVAAGTIISIGGICVASSFITPRSGVAMAENGIMPAVIGKRNGKNAPYVAIIISATISLLIAWSGTFETLAQISVVSRFAQYIPTCLAVIVFRYTRKEQTRTFKIPGGWIIPVVAILVSGWLLIQVNVSQLLFGFGALLIAVPFYLGLRKNKTSSKK